MRSNCIIVTLAIRRRRRAKGKVGRIYWRFSLFKTAIPIIHWMWGERVAFSRSPRFVSFVPTETDPVFLPPILFEGRIKLGDMSHRSIPARCKLVLSNGA